MKYLIFRDVYSKTKEKQQNDQQIRIEITFVEREGCNEGELHKVSDTLIRFSSLNWW